MASVAVWKILPTGELKIDYYKQNHAPTTLDASSAQLPGGAYTTFRTFQSNRVTHFDNHLIRLEESARLAQISVNLDEIRVREAVREAVTQYPSEEKRVRLTLDLEQQPGTVYIQVEALKVPAAQDYRDGVKVVTRYLKRQNPKAKLTNFISKADTIRQKLPCGINEALMVDERGQILEGLSSNFFAVRDGEIWTAEEGVLSGITRLITFEEIQAEGIPLHLTPVFITDLPSLHEAFITSSSRAVLPVVRVDETAIGDGLPGPLSLRLLDRYQRHIERETEPL